MRSNGRAFHYEDVTDGRGRGTKVGKRLTLQGLDSDAGM
jgi:hypothetical protein